jgi:hypothetical protein
MKYSPAFGKGCGNWKFRGVTELYFVRNGLKPFPTTTGLCNSREWFQTIPYKTPETQNKTPPCLWQRWWQLEILGVHGLYFFRNGFKPFPYKTITGSSAPCYPTLGPKGQVGQLAIPKT